MKSRMLPPLLRGIFLIVIISLVGCSSGESAPVPNVPAPKKETTNNPTKEPEEETKIDSEEDYDVESKDEIICGEILNGILTAKTDDDYTFQGSAGEMVTIEMIDLSDLEPYLELLDPNGQELSSEYGEDSAIIKYTLPQNGTYTISAGDSLYRSGEYTLSIFCDSKGKENEPEETQEEEPEEQQEGFNIDTIGTIFCGVRRDDSLPEEEDIRDYWTFQGSAGDMVTIEMIGYDGMQPVLALKDPGDNYLLAAYGFIGDYTLPSTGTYTIVAMEDNFESGDYTLSLFCDTEEEEQQEETDPSQIPQACNGSETYGPIQVGSAVILGRHRSVNGEDNWAIDMNAYVGSTTTVIGLIGVDGSGCPVVEVDIDGGQFAWRIRDLQLTEKVEYEEEEEQQETKTMSCGYKVAGVIPFGEVQKWIFDGVAGESVTIATSGTDGVTDTYLELYDSDGNLLTSDDDGGLDHLDSRITCYTLPTTDTYQIVVRDYNDAGGDYLISVVCGECGGEVEEEEEEEEEQEEQEEQPETLTISCGESKEGIVSSGERDLWTFQAYAGDYVHIYLEESGGDFSSDPYLELYGPDEMRLDSDNNSGLMKDALIHSYHIFESGTYTILARDANGNDLTYDLSLVCVEQEVMSALQCGDHVGGGWQSGDIYVNEGEEHLYLFEGSVGDVISINMFETSGMDTYLELIAPSGNLLAYDDDSGMGANDFIDAINLNENGTYFIIAHGYDWEEGNYSLSLTCNP